MGQIFHRKKNLLPKDINDINNIGNNNNVLIKEEPLCLKIYLIGNGKLKDYLIDYVFIDHINDSYLKTKGDRELKTDQFHWIFSVLSCDSPSKDICDFIKQQISEDRNEKLNDNNKRLLKQRIIICIGKGDLLASYFKDMIKPRIIFITHSKYDINIDKRYVINIIDENMNIEEIASQIMSCLWELDCYFNRRGNKICRYSPEKILKCLEKDNSLFSINILLLGKSGAGKSTFVNLISKKILALESDESSTKKITEYYIYKDDDKEEHGAIKLIDTPGIDSNNNNNTEIINMIKNNDKETNLQKKIHFIFFILMNGDNSLEEQNIETIFKTLKEKKCKCPIYFIINRCPEEEDVTENYEILKDYLISKDCDTLLNENNIIGANFKIGDDEIYGIDKIFSKIKDYFISNNIFNEQLKKTMDKLLKNFRKIESDNCFLTLNDEYESELEQLKSNINFEEEMNNIKKLSEKNEFFSKIKVESIIDCGREYVKECINTILAFSNIKGIMPTISKDIQIISFLQAFMVKEIENGYGLNINSLNYGLKLLKKNFEDILEFNKNYKGPENGINEEIEYNKKYNLMPKEIQDIIDKSNKQLIFQLAILLDKLAEMAKWQMEDIKDFNKEFTINIEKYCIMFFEKEIRESEGLTFMVNYYNKLKSLLNDIDYYINNNNWGNFEIEIKK